MLILFFILGSVATKIKQKQKEADMPYPETEEEAARRGGAEKNSSSSIKPARKGRDMYQVFATGLIPALICAGRHWTFSSSYSSSVGVDGYFLPSSAESTQAPYVREYWLIAYTAFLACCLGDTLASEIGMLSSQPPILLMRPGMTVRKGIDGGMTLQGTLASIVGGAIIGACAGTLVDTMQGAVWGCIGGLLDSLLGTLLQSSQYLTASASVSSSKNGVASTSSIRLEAPLPLTPHRWKHLNALVNVISALATAALACEVQLIASRLDLFGVMVSTQALVCLLLVSTVTPNLPAAGAIASGAVAIIASTLVSYNHSEIGLAMQAAVLALYAIYRLK